jgi:hypothetical protein
MQGKKQHLGVRPIGYILDMKGYAILYQDMQGHLLVIGMSRTPFGNWDTYPKMISIKDIPRYSVISI